MVSEGKYADAYDAARGLDNPIERRTVQWAAIYYGNGAIAYDAVQRFEADAADFVSTGVFKTRLEQALIKGGAADDTLISALSGAMPNTLDAQIALAKAYLNTGKRDRAAGIARDIWINDVLDARTEQRVLDSLGALLTSKDHSRVPGKEARLGRHWLDIGSGDWDAHRRPSEIRLDRVLRIDPDTVRREASIMPRAQFEQIVGALTEIKGW